MQPAQPDRIAPHSLAASHGLLSRLAGKYLWWQAPDGAPHDARRIIAQVMDLGTHDDAEQLRQAVGDAVLADILRTAQPGWLSAKSWHYWHYALGLAGFGKVPALPQRPYP
jgi:hypothetical protein